MGWLREWHRLARRCRPVASTSYRSALGGSVLLLAPGSATAETSGWPNWARTDGPGTTARRFARLTRTGAQWTVHEFTAKDGYGPPDTRFLKRDSRGWIWRGATGGVYVSNGRDVAPNDWLHITAQNGLAAESTHPYGFFEDTDGTVWIAGEQGITHLKPGPAWFDAPHNAPAPRITRVEADGKVFLSPGAIPDAIETRPRLLRIEVGTLDGPPFREYPLRYRLPPSMPEWQLSRDGALEFQNLPANVYRLEVAYTGTGQSPILQFAFRVGPPPSKISWLWAIPAVLAAAVIIARRTPALERLHYRVQKAIFLVRRRISSGELPESRDSLGRPDHTGETLLGRYRLMQAISRGGFSVVYEARDLVEGTTRVAVKVINVSAQRELGKGSLRLRSRVLAVGESSGSGSHSGFVGDPPGTALPRHALSGRADVTERQWRPGRIFAKSAWRGSCASWGRCCRRSICAGSFTAT